MDVLSSYASKLQSLDFDNIRCLKERIKCIISHVSHASQILNQIASEDDGHSTHTQPAQEKMVSLKQLAELQILVEFIIWWGIYPSLLQLRFLGDINTSIRIETIVTDLAKKIRQPSKTLKLDSTCLLVALSSILSQENTTEQADEQDWILVLDTCVSSLERCVAVEIYSPFLTNKNISELVLCSLCFTLLS